MRLISAKKNITNNFSGKLQKKSCIVLQLVRKFQKAKKAERKDTNLSCILGS
jgi:hypothetical protein